MAMAEKEKIISIQTVMVELVPSRAEFFKRCCQYEEEIMKLIECGFFEYEKGELIVHKSLKKIRVIQKPEKWEWGG
jgi:hypothetical protein